MNVAGVSVYFLNLFLKSDEEGKISAGTCKKP
jgi:hypothetical protein